MKNKKQLFVLILILIASYNLNGMHILRKSLMRCGKPTSEGFAKGMRGLHNVAFLGITYSLLIYEFFDAYKNFYEHKKKIYDVSPEVDKFARETLKKYGYPASLYNSVHFKKTLLPYESFQSLLFGNIIKIPFSAEQLRKSQILYNNNKNSHNINNNKNSHNIIIQMIQKLWFFISSTENNENDSNKRFFNKNDSNKRLFIDTYFLPDNIPKKAKRSFMESLGLAENHTTFLLWQNALIHEACHLQHYHELSESVLEAMCPFAIHYASKKLNVLLKRKISILRKANNIVRGLAAIPSLPIKLASTVLLMKIIIPKTLGKFHEYQADQRVIARVSDPQALEKSAEFHRNLTILDDNKISLKISLTVEEPIRFQLTKKTTNKTMIKILKKYPWLKELYTIHPRYIVRSAYFVAAAKKLRENQS